MVDLFDASRERDGAILLPDGRPVHGIRLLKGRHLESGARYGEMAGPHRDGAPEATVLREWRPSRTVELESLMAEEGMSMRVGVRVREPRTPRELEVSLDGHNPKGGSLYRFSGRAKVDLRAWWAALEQSLSAPPAARAPVVGRAAHRLGKARLTVTPRPAEDGSWQVSVALSVRGRWLLRPVAAVALVFARRPIERGFREGVDSAAEEWAEMLAEVGPLHGEALRAEIADALTEPPELAESPEPLPRTL